MAIAEREFGSRDAATSRPRVVVVDSRIEFAHGILFADELPDGDVATARHWARVYDELVAFLDAMLADVTSGHDRSRLEQRRAALHLRAVFWHGELVRLEAAAAVTAARRRRTAR
jgi:hypothetical protein